MDQIKADLALSKETVKTLAEECLIFKLALLCSVIPKKPRKITSSNYVLSVT